MHPSTSVASAGVHHLRVDGLSHSYGDRRVLTDVSLTVAPGDRVGLIGENGVGKSTLLRLLGAAEPPDAGVLTRPASIGLLRQELPFDDRLSLGDVLEHALAAVRAAERELEDAAAALGEPAAGEGAAGSAEPTARYAHALETAERLEVWSAEARRDEVLAGLGLSDIPLRRRIHEVSGGQRSRLALAALLLARPEALVLDEPTNHLDHEASDYLARVLRGWGGPVLFASHDRGFLDDAATAVIDIDPSASETVRRFGSGFSDYLAEKAAERERWERRHEAEQEELARLRDSVAVTSRRVSHDRVKRDTEKLLYDASGERVQSQISRRVRNARHRLDELTAGQVGAPPAVLRFAGIPNGAHPLPDDAGALIAADRVWVSGRLATDAAPVSVTVRPLSRILVTGVNGSGKSTLLGLLAGGAPVSGIEPGASLSGGTVTRRKGVRTAMLAQDVRYADPDVTPRALYARTVGEAVAARLPLAALGLIAPRDLDRPIGVLSVGQRRRLALALIVARPPHVFVLDEPTNHLSLALAGELEDAFGEYPGAVVVASHDRWLRRRWEGDTLAL